MFLNRNPHTAPLALRANVKHNHVRHEHILIVAIETKPVPRVRASRRVVVSDLGYADEGIIHITIRCGYMEMPDVPAALRRLDPDQTEGKLELAQATYYLSKIEVTRGEAPTLAAWRKRLFLATSHITADAAEHVNLPRDRTVMMGSQIEV